MLGLGLLLGLGLNLDLCVPCLFVLWLLLSDRPGRLPLFLDKGYGWNEALGLVKIGEILLAGRLGLARLVGSGGGKCLETSHLLVHKVLNVY